MRDINVLLDALLTPPRPGAHDNARHFHESARAIVAGYMAWVRFHEVPQRRTLKRVHDLLSMAPDRRKAFAAHVKSLAPFAGGLAHIAVEREAQVGKEEGGSNFTTIANQLAFLNYPEMAANTGGSSFDPLVLADGDTDLFVVAPEETVEHVKGWLRLWVAIPNAVAGIRPLKRDMVIVIDEMPRIGYLKPVMDGYTMAAGKGVHFWCFAQSISALDSSWGKEHRRTLLHLAEVVQVLGFPRTDAEGAEELSKAIGTATFEGRTESRSGTVAENRVVTANTQWQAGESRSLVRERLVTPDELMTLGPDRQYVIAAPKDMPRDALHLHHARYWRRPDSDYMADPNPFVVRKERAAGAGGETSLPDRLRRLVQGAVVTGHENSGSRPRRCRMARSGGIESGEMRASIRQVFNRLCTCHLKTGGGRGARWPEAKGSTTGRAYTALEGDRLGQTTVEPVLGLLEAVRDLGVRCLHHDVATPRGAGVPAEAMGSTGVRKASDPVSCIRRAARGDRARSGRGHLRAGRAGGAARGRLRGTRDPFRVVRDAGSPRQHSQPVHAPHGALALFSYRSDVDRLLSCAFDLLLLEALQRVPFTAQGMQQLERLLKETALRLGSTLAFRIDYDRARARRER